MNNDFLNQDLCYPLFQWFASKPDARRLVRERVKEIEMKVKTSELIGPALDWAVLKCLGFTEGSWHHNDGVPQVWVEQVDRAGNGPAGYFPDDSRFRFSINWASGGPIIEREELSLQHVGIFGETPNIVGPWASSGAGNSGYGPTPLIAAMRCYVASKLGDEVEVPEELK